MFELLLQADKSLSEGLLDQAERTYWQLIELDPTNAIAMAGLAMISLERQDKRLARTFAERALGIDPDSIVARRVLQALDEGAALPSEAATPDAALLGAEKLEALSRRRTSQIDGDEGGGSASTGRDRSTVRGKTAQSAASTQPPSADKPDRGRARPGEFEAPTSEPLRERRKAGRLAAAAAAAAAAVGEPSHVRHEPHHAMPAARRPFEPSKVRPAQDPFAAAEMAAAVAAVDSMDEPFESESLPEPAPAAEATAEVAAEATAEAAAAEPAAEGPVAGSWAEPAADVAVAESWAEPAAEVAVAEVAVAESWAEPAAEVAVAEVAAEPPTAEAAAELAAEATPAPAPEETDEVVASEAELPAAPEARPAEPPRAVDFEASTDDAAKAAAETESDARPDEAEAAARAARRRPDSRATIEWPANDRLVSAPAPRAAGGTEPSDLEALRRALLAIDEPEAVTAETSAEAPATEDATRVAAAEPAPLPPTEVADPDVDEAKAPPAIQALQKPTTTGAAQPQGDEWDLSEANAEREALREAVAIVMDEDDGPEAAAENSGAAAPNVAGQQVISAPAQTASRATEPPTTEPETPPLESPPDAIASEEASAVQDPAPRKKGLFRRIRG